MLIWLFNSNHTDWAAQNLSSTFRALSPNPRNNVSGRGWARTCGFEVAISMRSLSANAGSVPYETLTGISTSRRVEDKVQLVTWLERRVLLGRITSAP